MTTIGKDRTNSIFLIAWAVVETENKEACKWFLQLLTEDLNFVASSTNWVKERGEFVTFISDRKKVYQFKLVNFLYIGCHLINLSLIYDFAGTFGGFSFSCSIS